MGVTGEGEERVCVWCGGGEGVEGYAKTDY